MDTEDSNPPRRSRPAFADDVYGTKKEDEKVELCESSLAQRRSANLVKLKELREGNNAPTISERREQAEIKEEQEIEFTYDDCDSYQNEIAELYAYSELGDYSANLSAYKFIAEEKQIFTPFSSLSRAQQKGFIVDLVCDLESADGEVRLRCSRALLYILQGAFVDFADEEDEPRKGTSKGTGYHEVDCLIAALNMAYLSYEAGALPALISLLRTELDAPFDGAREDESGRESKASGYSNSRSASNMDFSENERRCRRSATLEDNESLRVALSCLYHLVEGIRRPELIERVVATQERRSALTATRQRFLAELEEPVEQVGSPLVVLLLDMCPSFYNGEAPHYPMRKVLLLIWKILLAMLGGWEELRVTKEALREKAGLPYIEDTLQVAASMKASLLRESEGMVARARPRVKLAMSRQLACTGDEGAEDSSEQSDDNGNNEDEEEKSLSGGTSVESDDGSSNGNRDGERTPTADSPGPLRKRKNEPTWKAKTRVEDIDAFIQSARTKFLQFELPGDTETLFGLPAPIHTSVNTLRRHLYTSLADLQMKREEALNRYPFSQKEVVEETKAELLYRWMLPNMSYYVVALLKILLAAAPSNKAKNDALNILCDVLTTDTEASDVLSNSISLDHSTSQPLEDSLKLTIDINRHKEVMVKATSTVLLLLLKHFKQNHIYQFEYLAQHIALGNGVPLILKFLDQNMAKYMQSRHEIYAYNFPQAPLFFVRNQEWPQLNAENVEATHPEGVPYSMWRNVFSSINLLRILNKITKWKHSRTMLLVVFKSAPILKRCLKMRLALFQVYVLKLLKMQSRYLGRQWRRCNMDVISSIYSKIRHRLGDDWAYANDTRTKSWHFRNMEPYLKVTIEKFNSRRYGRMYPIFQLDGTEDERENGGDEGERMMSEDEPLAPVTELVHLDNNAQSLLGKRVQLGEKFKKNYEEWMDKEVIRANVDWDLLLTNSRGIME